MAFARFVKKIVTPVAILATSLMAFTGVTPANAAAPTGANNLATTSVDSNWVIGTGNQITLAGTTDARWYAEYEARTTNWSGKVLSLVGSITPAITGATGSVNASLNYWKADGSLSTVYNYGYINGASSMNDNHATVPSDAARITISINASFASGNMNGGGVNFASGTTYNPTFTLKLDGTAVTVNNTWTGSNSGASNDVHLTTQPMFTQNLATGTFSGNAAYTSAYQNAYSCVDTANLAVGDALQIHPIIDGVDKYSDNSVGTNNRVQNVDNANSGGGSTVFSNATTLTQAQKTTGGQLVFTSSYSRYSQRLQPGTNSLTVSIQNASGVELNVPCALAPLDSSVVPTVAVSGSYLAVTVNDASFLNKNFIWAVYKASDNSLLGTGQGYSNNSNQLTNCGMSGCFSVAPVSVPVYVKVAKSVTIAYFGNSNVVIQAPWSTQSANATLPDPWISVTPAVSGGTAPGNASVISSNLDYTAAAQDPTLMLPTSPSASDGNNGILKPVITADFTQQNPVIKMKLFRIGAAGIDSTFGGGGAAGVTIGNDLGPSSYASTGWFGARNKWVASVRSSIPGPNAVTTFTISQGNFASASTVAPIVKTSTELSTYCATLVAGSTGVSITPVSAATTEPIFTVSCSKSFTVNSTTVYGYTITYVKIAADGTITKLAQMDTGDGVAESNWTTISSVANVSASAASDVALTVIGYTSKWVSPTQSDIVTRKGIQIKVDGSVTDVATPYSSTATTQQTEKSYLFSRTSLGAATTGFLRTVAAGVTSYKWARLGADGVITEGDPVTFDAEPAFNLTLNGATVDGSLIGFVDGQEVGTGGKIQMRRFLGSSKMASVTVDLDAKTFDTGEVVSYISSMDSRVIQLFFVDDQGRLNWMFTSASNTLSLIRWNGVNASGGALPAGVTVTNVSTSFITNGAAAVTITGTGLNLITGKLTIGGVLVNPTSKTATKLVFTIPAGTVAGAIDIIAPFAAGPATLGSVNRIGANKQVQTITDVPDIQRNWTGTAITADFPAASSVGLPNTITAAPAALCSVSGTTVSVNGSGTCTVTVAQAGDLGTNAATSQTTAIVVAPRVQNLSALLTAIASANRAWDGSQATITLPAAVSSAGLAVTIAVTPAAVCTNVANVITVKSAGDCTVSLTTSKDNGTPALAKATAKVTIAKGDLALTAANDFTLSDSAADSNNVVNVNADVATGAESLVDYTYTSSNEDVCTVDDDGNVTGVAAGSCKITIAADAGANWVADSEDVNVTVQTSVAVPADVLPDVSDSGSPKAIVSNKNAFVATNDKSFLVKWDKATGTLSYQATGIYIGWIKTETTFTVGGTAYTCVNVFGTTAPLKGATPAQRKLALKSKVFNGASAVCKDASKLTVPASIGAPADFAKIAKAAKTAAEKSVEASAFTKLKNFAGNVTIKITRYRAWPTSMKNLTSAGKKIPATVRNTVVALQ